MRLLRFIVALTGEKLRPAVVEKHERYVRPGCQVAGHIDENPAHSTGQRREVSNRNLLRHGVVGTAEFEPSPGNEMCGASVVKSDRNLSRRRIHHGHLL